MAVWIRRSLSGRRAFNSAPDAMHGSRGEAPSAQAGDAVFGAGADVPYMSSGEVRSNRPPRGNPMAPDDFPQRVKSAVALRAAYLCSFAACGQRTAGPSDESPVAVANIGEAAHICGARPGSRRYVESMTPEERSSIHNAIWLCVHHARLIDRDEATFTIEQLLQMKRGHEALCAISATAARR
jgi:hypothetical protein